MTSKTDSERQACARSNATRALSLVIGGHVEATFEQTTLPKLGYYEVRVNKLSAAKIAFCFKGRTLLPCVNFTWPQIMKCVSENIRGFLFEVNTGDPSAASSWLLSFRDFTFRLALTT
jgi:hypothetical protein